MRLLAKFQVLFIRDTGRSKKKKKKKDLPVLGGLFRKSRTPKPERLVVEEFLLSNTQVNFKNDAWS